MWFVEGIKGGTRFVSPFFGIFRVLCVWGLGVLNWPASSMPVSWKCTIIIYWQMEDGMFFVEMSPHEMVVCLKVAISLLWTPFASHWQLDKKYMDGMVRRVTFGMLFRMFWKCCLGLEGVRDVQMIFHRWVVYGHVDLFDFGVRGDCAGVGDWKMVWEREGGDCLRWSITDVEGEMIDRVLMGWYRSRTVGM